MKKTTVIATILLTGIACAGIAVSEPANIRTPLIHVIVSDEIQTIMLELNRLMADRALTELQATEKRVQHLNNLIKNVDELVIAAENMTDAIPGVRMTDETRLTFEALTRQLQTEAENIKTMAGEYEYAGMEPAWQRLLTTCDACHRLFRF